MDGASDRWVDKQLWTRVREKKKHSMPTVEWGRAHLNARRTRHRHGGRPLAAVRGRGLRKVVERHSVGVDAVRRKELATVRLGNGGEQRVRALLSRQNVNGLII